MSDLMQKTLVAFGLAGALALGAAAPAAAMPTSAAAVKAATPDATVQARWYGPGPFFAGAALGAVATGAWGPYYSPYYGYYPYARPYPYAYGGYPYYRGHYRYYRHYRRHW